MFGVCVLCLFLLSSILVGSARGWERASERAICLCSVGGGVVREPALAAGGGSGGDGVFDTRRTQA